MSIEKNSGLWVDADGGEDGVTEAEEARRAYILSQVANFDRFLRDTEFTVVDLELLDKTLEHWMGKVIYAQKH